MNLPDAESEKDSKRDGFLSYSKEVHALIIGLFAGLTTGLTGTWQIAAIIGGIALGVRAAPIKPLKQLKKEPWYALGGILGGFTVGALLRIATFAF